MVRISHYARRLWRAIGATRYETRHWLWNLRRLVVRSLTDPALARKLVRFRRNVRRRDWPAALNEALRIASIAEGQRDAKLMEEMGKALWLLGEHRRAAQLRLDSRRLRNLARPNEWNGENLTGKTLVIDLMETTKQGLSHAFLTGSLAAQAVKRSGHCIFIVEPRIVPLYKRSFPKAEVMAVNAGRDVAYAAADYVASALHLAAIFSIDAKTIGANYHRLVPDPKLVEEFRAKYRRGARGTVGISWASSAFGKDIPRLVEWTQLLQSTDATFVSLQYGKIEDDLETLRRGSPGGLIHDNTVDQMTDMDRFAAQVASLDAVVSISNTAAHLAGVLGVPAIVLPDDRLRLWPVFVDRVPWYPETVVIRKNGREWDRVMQEAAVRLRAIIEANPALDRPADVAVIQDARR